MNAKLHKQQGFTLVEIAIVLVIIGLLLGAVFKGQELINQAKVKNVTKKMDEVRAAAYTYLDKYNALPGDDGTAHTNPTITAVTSNADDGQINDSDFWTQIHEAGLLEGSGSTAAKTPYGTPLYVGYNAAGLGDNAVCALVPAEVAQQIDDKHDDGDATKGSYRDGGTTASAPSTTAPTATAYTATAGNHWLCTKL